MACFHLFPSILLISWRRRGQIAAASALKILDLFPVLRFAENFQRTAFQLHRTSGNLCAAGIGFVIGRVCDRAGIAVAGPFHLADALAGIGAGFQRDAERPAAFGNVGCLTALCAPIAFNAGGKSRSGQSECCGQQRGREQFACHMILPDRGPKRPFPAVFDVKVS